MGAVTTDKHIHNDFINAAAADGWAVAEGPWGYSESHERTVTLTKHFPDLKGSILLWMIHRNMGSMSWSAEKSRWVTTYPENQWMVSAEAWFKADSGGDENLSPNLTDVLLNGLSEGYWTTLAFTCDNCGKVVDHVNHVAFANKACDACAPELRRTLERPGWSN